MIAHLSVLALLVLVSEVHPLGSAAEPIAVNIVTPEESEPQKPEPSPQSKPEPQFALPDPSPSAPSQPAVPAPATPPPASAPQPAAKAPAARPDRGTAVAAAAPPPAQSGSASPGYRPAEPDISVKYNVMLGLPVELPPPAAKPGKSAEGFDETTSNADISSAIIAEFRRHLKSCSKLPASVQPSDHIRVKLRVVMTQDGRLAVDPMVGGGSANPRAIDLLQSAIAGLKQCQPYKMLPADRYGEWKVLDLDFTPKDF